MKWHRVRPNKQLFFLLLCAALALTWGFFLHSAPAPLKQRIETTQQFGFYDVMLQQHELYDSHMSTAGNMILSTFSSSANPDFVLKSNFVQSYQQHGKRYFAYAPVHFNPAKRNRMITNNVDLLLHSQIWMQQIEPDGVPLVHMQNGMIFLYTLESD